MERFPLARGSLGSFSYVLMSWDELRKFLEAEDEKNKPGEAARVESLRTATEPAAERRARRLDREYAARTVVSQACWHFATTGRWPAMDGEATLYAHDRWIWAMWWRTDCGVDFVFIGVVYVLNIYYGNKKRPKLNF